MGIAISPVPIIAAILMLLSAQARATGSGFLIGWIAGIVVATAVFTAVAGALSTGGDPAPWASWTKVVLGVLLLLLGVRQWRARSGPPSTPAWMSAIDSLTAVKAVGLGFALAAVNPKNLLLAAAAGVAIGSVDLGVGGTIVAIAVFTVIAASTVAGPVLAYLVAGPRMRAPLDTLKAWLQANNATVMSVLLLVIGVVLVGKGIGGLSG